MTRPSGAMVLAAGLGTRLRPLTDELAKPMVPIGDRPAIAHAVERVKGAADRIAVNVHHRPEDVAAWAKAEGIAVSEEKELLGTAGGVARGRTLGLLGAGDVLVWNADIVSDLDPSLLVRGDAEAVLAVRERAAGEGNVGVDASGKIVRLRAERFGEETRGGEFLGIHVLGAAIADALPPKGCLVGDVYLPLLRRGGLLRAIATSTPFVDVGSIAQYLAANRAWLGDRPSWAHGSARIHASIEGSVIGESAVVEADAIRCVVWPGARVTAPVADAVVTPRQIVYSR